MLLFVQLRPTSPPTAPQSARHPRWPCLMADARRCRFDVVLIAAFDRIARNVRHFLEVLDELNHLGIEFVSLRENIDTGGPLGRAMLTIIGAISALELDIIRERICAGMRRATLEGRRIGRAPLDIDRAKVVADRQSGMSLTQVAKKHRVSRATVCRLVNEFGGWKKLNGPRPGEERSVPLSEEHKLLAAA
jgi:DNA invertase Pin-like site-specific DNA recombinase